MPAASRPYLFLAILALGAATAFAAPEFVAVQSGPDGVAVGLRLAPDEKVRWLPLGAHAGDYTVSTYDAEKETVTLRRADSTTVALRLKDAATQPALPTVASFDYLRQDSDRAKRVLYVQAIEMDRARQATLRELTKAESTGGKDNPNSQTLGPLRRQLAEQEARLARQLTLLQEATARPKP